MEGLFITLFNMSITASWMVLAVIILRFTLQKAPKWIMGVLWGFVGLRLVFPFSIESILSLIPSTETIPEDIMIVDRPYIDTGVETWNEAVNPSIGEALAPTPGASINPMQILLSVASNIWVLGVLVMLGYALISFLLLRKKVKEAIRIDDRVFVCDHIHTPFILGVFRPRIYLPSVMEWEDIGYVLAHEEAHLKRFDHVWKPLGFVLLSVYWYNPILWLAYVCLCKDIELACDEKVLKELGTQNKKPYAEALINCSIPRRMITACPLAFGEVAVKERVKSVLNYKKPAFWIVLLGLVACIAAAVCLLTNPKQEAEGGTDTEINSEENKEQNSEQNSGLDGTEAGDKEIVAIPAIGHRSYVGGRDEGYSFMANLSEKTTMQSSTSNNHKNGYLVRISSKEELWEFYSEGSAYFTFSSERYDEDTQFLNLANKYDDAYFEKSDLLIIPFWNPSTRSAFYLLNAYEDGSVFNINVLHYVPSGVQFTFDNWFLTIEVEKQYTENKDSYKINIIYDKQILPSGDYYLYDPENPEGWRENGMLPLIALNATTKQYTLSEGLLSSKIQTGNYHFDGKRLVLKKSYELGNEYVLYLTAEGELTFNVEESKYSDASIFQEDGMIFKSWDSTIKETGTTVATSHSNFVGGDRYEGAEWFMRQSENPNMKGNDLLTTPAVLRISSEEELKGFYENGKKHFIFDKQVYENTTTFEESIKNYDSKFFEENDLIILLCLSPVKNNCYEIASFRAGEDNITINVTKRYKTLEPSTSGQFWFLSFAANKKLVQNRQNISVNVEMDSSETGNYYLVNETDKDSWKKLMETPFISLDATQKTFTLCRKAKLWSRLADGSYGEEADKTLTLTQYCSGDGTDEFSHLINRIKFFMVGASDLCFSKSVSELQDEMFFTKDGLIFRR